MKMSLPEWFSQNSNEIQNYSWDGQIIWSYKTSIQSGFSDSLFIMAVDWFSWFSNWYIAKLQKNLKLQDFSKKTRSINCNKNKIDYDIISFKIFQSWNLDTDSMNIYYSQAYILQSLQGYIVSFSTNDSNKAKNYAWVINSIWCK